AYDDPALGRRAILRVRNASEVDVLAPDEEGFEFGAEFRHDEATTGDPTDNGDNLIQRGLFGDGAQYKIDIDKRTPSCRIEGAGGVVQVKSSLRVDADVWYAVQCSRQGDEVRLVVLRYDDGRFRELADDSGQGTTGSITWEDVKQPMSVGGKLTVRGEVVEKASDQFNGAVANPYFTINE
ncbi:MAG: LamG domain-containing protein, partial [Ornithinimicrobium sp.]